MRGLTHVSLIASIACSDPKPKPVPAPIDGIELVELGAEPHHLLRYKASTEAQLEIAMDVDMRTVDGAAVLPTLVLDVDLVFAAPDTSGAVKAKLTVVGSSSRARGEQDQTLVKIMERQASLMKGLVVTFTLSPWGHVSNSKVETAGRDLSEPMQEQVKTLLQRTESLAMALPETPVGAGAIWKHRKTMQQNQLTLASVTTVEVVAIDGDKITYKGTMEMTGADQTITQGSASARVVGVRGTGTQTGTFDLSKAIVLGTTTATLSFELVVDGQQRPNKMEVVTTVAPREPKPVEPSDAGID